MMDKNRIYKYNRKDAQDGPVIYWMSRDQRVHDNWALLYAQEIALEQNRPLGVVFCLVSEFLDATLRQYEFMLKGLEEVEEVLRGYNIPFHLLTGSPEHEIPKYIGKRNAGIVISDFAPLRIQRTWRDKVAESVTIPMYEVDAHNIVPCRVASVHIPFVRKSIECSIRI
jgi:deoxyribodipyrimidine photo-lyase